MTLRRAQCFPRAMPSSAAGISLIEMLVTLLVLSIGLLGVASLQVYSLRHNSGAYFRSQASVLAYDIADRMRANRSVALAGSNNYDIALAASKPSSLTDVRQQDLNEWLTALETLPGGDGQIACVAATRTCQVTVQWNDSRGGSGPTQFVLSTEL